MSKTMKKAIFLFPMLIILSCEQSEKTESAKSNQATAPDSVFTAIVTNDDGVEGVEILRNDMDAHYFIGPQGITIYDTNGVSFFTALSPKGQLFAHNYLQAKGSKSTFPFKVVAESSGDGLPDRVTLKNGNDFKLEWSYSGQNLSVEISPYPKEK